MSTANPKATQSSKFQANPMVKLAVCLFYGVISTTITYVNKSLYHKFNF